LLVEELRWFVGYPGSDANLPGQYRPTRLLAAREKSSADEQLIKP
jgi:hypothetical protein